MQMISVAKASAYEEVKKEGGTAVPLQQSREERAGFLAKATYSWIFPLLLTGASRPLEHTDLPSLLRPDESAGVADRFEALVARQYALPAVPLATPKEVMRFKLLRALLLLDSFTMTCAGLNMMVGALLGFVGPLALEGIVDYVDQKASGGSVERWGVAGAQLDVGQWWVVAMIAAFFTQNLCLHTHHHLSMRAAMRVKSALTMLIYRKAMRISPQSRNAFGVGMINNLALQDSNAVGMVFWFVHYSWNAPMQLALCLYLLYRQIGPSAFIAIAVLLFTVPVQGQITQRISALSKETSKFADTRIKFISEVFSGIRIVKLMGWESSFQRKIEAARAMELEMKRRLALMGAVTTTLMLASPLLVALATFPAYASEEGMTASGAFSALTLFNILRLPLMIIPMLLGSAASANASLDRISTFMASSDMVEYRVEAGHEEGGSDKHVASLRGATLAWVRKELSDDGAEATEEESTSRQAPAATLHNVNLQLPRGALTVIVGAVGSGKSSLLSALLGEMECWEGEVGLSESRSSIAYAAQQPFILNATVRDNIIFGAAVDEARYVAVLDACALTPDLAVLPSGDGTEIGERGVNLSGGQKARVALARALYSRCPLLLLDDPLSAVDAHVARHLADKVLRGDLVADRSVVLVTHQVVIAAPIADYVVVMDTGRVVQAGSFSVLRDVADGLFRCMLDLASVRAAAATSTPSGSQEGSQVTEGSVAEGAAAPASSDSVAIVVRDEKAAGAKIISDEDRLRGGVPMAVYTGYLGLFGSSFLALIVFTLVAANVGSVSIDWFLGLWSTNSLSQSVGYYIGVYAAIIAGTVIISFIGSIVWAFGGIFAASELHRDMLSRVIRAPSSFFDTTPLGRILNRFSTDIATVDSTLPSAFANYVTLASKIVSIIIVQAIILPFTLVAWVPIGCCYHLVQNFYRNSSRELKRLTATSQSPINAHISETLQGLTTIRAYGGESAFESECQRRIDENNKASYIANCMNRWLGLRLDWIGALLVGTTGVVAVLTAGQVGAGLIGLAIAYSLSVTGLLNWMVRGSTETESHLASVERVQFYSAIPVERAAIVPDRRPHESWPQFGAIAVRSLTTRYRPELEPVLRAVSFDVQPGHKVGVCGRTGSGKSSLMLALFRVIEADAEAGGCIEIDGVDIAGIGLDDLRSRMAIIPQDPTLFAGSLRYNLDPLDERSDDELSAALARVDGLQTAADSIGGLSGQVAEGGENLSVGQRQLVCLCRALLRGAKVLVLDEATASVDGKTDDMIQKMLRAEAFAQTTVLVIAHRINTIVDCDRVLVLDQGRVVEFDRPSDLIARGGAFADLVRRSEGNRGHGE